MEDALVNGIRSGRVFFLNTFIAHGQYNCTIFFEPHDEYEVAI